MFRASLAAGRFRDFGYGLALVLESGLDRGLFWEEDLVRGLQGNWILGLGGWGFPSLNTLVTSLRGQIESPG